MAIRTNFQFNMEQHWYAFAYEIFFSSVFYVSYKPVFEDYVEVIHAKIWRYDDTSVLQRRKNKTKINDNINNNNNKLSIKTKQSKKIGEDKTSKQIQHKKNEMNRLTCIK